MDNHDFVKFLNTLSIDPILTGAFKDDPDAVLSKYSLSVEEKELLTSGDPEKINLALSATEEVWGARVITCYPIKGHAMLGSVNMSLIQ